MVYKSSSLFNICWYTWTWQWTFSTLWHVHVHCTNCLVSEHYIMAVYGTWLNLWILGSINSTINPQWGYSGNLLSSGEICSDIQTLAHAPCICGLPIYVDSAQFQASGIWNGREICHLVILGPLTKYFEWIHLIAISFNVQIYVLGTTWK